VRVLVCGGRNFGRVPRDTPANEIANAIAKAEAEKQFLNLVLNWHHNDEPFTALIEGDAKGADRLAGKWAEANQVPLYKFIADWKRLGLAAGFVRNSEMITEGKPSLVIAFPGGNGTKDMINQAKRAGIKVIEVNYVHNT
jgi:ABC-type Fe3+-hydroxamate transport system substrate-binding protein